MERDYGSEIEGLKAELREIRAMLKQNILSGGMTKIEPHAMHTGEHLLPPDGDEKLNEILKLLLAYTEEHGASGAVAYTGTFISGGEDQRQSLWASAIGADDLLKLNENHMVEKVLSSVGHSQRLEILLALLKKPMTVNQLIEELRASSTGQIYHHLKPLVSADIVKEEKGVYSVTPYRVQGVIMLLCGVWDLIDPRYTRGNWE